MSLTIGLIIARDKHEAAEIAEDVESWLIDAGVTVRSESDLLSGASVDLLVTLGGDGLIMRMAHVFPNIPILGINVGKGRIPGPHRTRGLAASAHGHRRASLSRSRDSDVERHTQSRQPGI